MTKRQVRAAMRRLRHQYEEEEEETGEINLVPYMDIVTNIIIFLLASVVNQIPLGNVNVTSPTLAGPGSAPMEQPETPPLNLTVTITPNNFIIAATGGKLEPIGLKPDGKHDFDALNKKLVEIKNQPGNGSETKAIFNSDAQIPYELVVKTIDAMREDPQGKALFPDIGFSAGVE